LKKKKTEREIQLEALKLENEEAVREMIRRLLAKPMNKRTNFLRKRTPGGSCL
jgi:hypothetical protein